MIPIQFRKDLNEILRLIAAKLDLDDTRFKNANDKYNAVTNWLIADDSNLKKYKPNIYPQGSFAMGTIVKPLITDEYDIDLVCELNGFLGNPEDIKYSVGKRLMENSIYQSPMLQEKNRCWRLIYAGEFHLDILPARPLSSVKISDTTIESPDKALKDWIISDPKGYIAWFMNQMSQQLLRNRVIMAELENKSVEDIPVYRVKTSLQQAIQLMKRNRDIVFKDDLDDKPISIIISTLAGLSYSNEADLFEALLALVKTMPNKIFNNNGVPWVMNPVNNNENFADKWEMYPQKKEKFIRWINNFSSNLEEINNYESIGNIEKLLKSLFGESVMEMVYYDFSKQQKSKSSTPLRTPPIVQINNPNKPWKE